MTWAAPLGTADSAVRIHARFEWAGLPEGVAGLAALALGAAVVLAVLTFYRRERASTAPRLRWVCCGLRLLCLGALALILLRPSVARDLERLLPGRLIILADSSASMSVRDAHLAPEPASGWARALRLPSGRSVAELTRHGIVLRLLEPEGAALVAEGSRANQVELMTFADDVRTVLEVPRRGPQPETAEPADVPPLPPWKATGVATDLARALSAALGRPAGGQLAAILLLTDGRDTEGGDLAAATRQAAERGVPVHVVGIGSVARPTNVAVVELSSGEHAIKGLPLQMRAYVRSDGYAGRTVAVVLTATQVKTGRTEEVMRRSVVLEGDGPRQAVDLTHEPEAVGAVRYVAQIELLEGESRPDDNSAAREVLVTEQKIRVLLAAGGPSREYRFLRALINRDPAFDLTVRLHGPSAGSGNAALPGERAALAGYDVILLCDASPAHLSAEWVDALADVVDSEGLGLAFLAGPAYTPELLGEPELARLHDLLPVVVDRARTRALVGGAGLFTDVRSLWLDDGSRGHAITNPGPGVEAARFWQEVPGLYWVLPAAKSKPGATVLLRCADPAFAQGTILAAVHSYGLGRVFYCGSPETWRWRRRGIEHYDRFWLQALRYCTGGRLTDRDRPLRISLDRRVCTPGQPVRVRARAVGPESRQVEGQWLELAVELNGRRVGTVELRRSPAEPEVYEGVLYPDAFGRHELVYVAPDGTRAAASLEVRRPDIEFRDVRMARQAMEELAASTGGRYLEPGELDQLPGLIPDRARTVVEPGPLEPLWDTAGLLALLVAALGAEWALRKWMGML